MKLFLIGDSFSILGYRLAGVHGSIVNSKEEASQTLKQAIQDPDIGIILITQRIASEIQALVDQTKSEKAIPVILEIPDRSGPLEGRESALDIVQRLLGIKI